MGFTFRPAKRENVNLLIGLAGGTGSGKTYTAMELASGISGDKPFAVIDTENERAKHYADMYRFDHGDLQPPFTPKAYEEAVLAADAAGYRVIVIDSVSHEHAGDGGILDMHEAELDRMAGDNWAKREACKMAAWIKPKMQHKEFVQKLLRVKAHVIVCLRAEAKIEMAKENGKMVIRPKQSIIGHGGWIPICEKSLPFEMTVSFMLLAERPGFGLPIKLQEQHKAFFPSNKPINKNSGKLIAKWSAGKSRDVPLTEVDDDALTCMAAETKKAIEDPTKAKLKAKNQALLDALRDEYRRRHPPEDQTPPMPASDHNYGPGEWKNREPGSDG